VQFDARRQPNSSAVRTPLGYERKSTSRPSQGPKGSQKIHKFEAFQTIWSAPEHPTAIVCFSDIIAFGVLDAARELGVSMPQEVSVTGFDDLAEAQW